MEYYYSAIKIIKLFFVGKYMEPEIIMLREINQTQKEM
jgi:hypothetical protein